MKTYSNKKSKAKTVVLTIVLVLMAAMIAALAASVITGTQPQNWFKKQAQAFKSTPIKNGDVLSFNDEMDGLPLYMTRDKEELNKALASAEKLGSSEDRYFTYLLNKGSVIDGVFDEDDLIGCIAILNASELSDNGLTSTGWCIMMGFLIGDTPSMFILYDYDAQEFGEIVAEDGRIVFSDANFEYEVYCISEYPENYGQSFFDTDAVIFSTTPFAA